MVSIILPTEYKVVKGLDKVKDINKSLDAYRDSAEVRPQTVVKIEGRTRDETEGGRERRRSRGERGKEWEGEYSCL